ncbi:sensor histidine kinase, partial [bacterium]|nr:sensor histidine kinase [bacterium]
KAVPLGLLCNEVLTNSLRHAFPDDRRGEIRIKISMKADDTVELIISDNGIGLPEDVDFKNSDTMGFQLINALIDQIEGTYEINSEHGMFFRLEFANS